MKRSDIQFEFVELMPAMLEDGVIYISMEYATASHLCLCGCGEKVVTPFSPTDWNLMFDGVSISISPSIGNWDFACRSHYWITNSEVRWAPLWTREQILAARARERFAKEKYYGEQEVDELETVPTPQRPGVLGRILRFFRIGNRSSRGS
jgi:hypothetical protein